MEFIEYFFGTNSFGFHFAGVIFSIIGALLVKYHLYRKRNNKTNFNLRFWWIKNKIDVVVSIMISFLFARFSNILLVWINPKLSTGFNFEIPITDDAIFYYFFIGGLTQLWIHKKYRTQ